VETVEPGKPFSLIGKGFSQGKWGKTGVAALRRLLGSWHATLTAYTRSTHDLAYWYNERANIGALAAATWRLGNGNVAVEEYTVVRNKKRGRCDLYVYLDGVSFVAEAKVYFPRKADRKRVRQEVRDRLTAARKQIAKLDGSEVGDWNLAACFVVPRVSLRPLKSMVDAREEARKFWACLREDFADATHLVDIYECPKSLMDNACRDLGISPGKPGNYVWPGVALVMERVQKAQ
jgi:hypothetical protein